MNNLNQLTIFIVVILGMSSCDFTSSTSNSGYGSGQSYEESKMIVEETEHQNPLSFLSVRWDYRQKILGGDWAIRFKIDNKASLATYKDIILEFQFYSQTDTYLGSEEFIYYQYIPAGESWENKTKLSGYPGAKKKSI